MNGKAIMTIIGAVVTIAQVLIESRSLPKGR